MIKTVVIIVLMSTISGCKTGDTIKEDSLLYETPFGVCYSKVTPDQVNNYKMVIIEPDFYTRKEVNALKAKGTKIIAYLTLGEVDKNRWYFPLLEARGFRGINANWGSSFLDLSDEETRSIIIDKALPEIMLKGVDGLFLDTIDSVSPYTDRNDLEPYMIELIKTLRSKYPETTIIQNAGLFLLEDTKESINGVLIEDIASGYDFSESRYYVKNKEAYTKRLDMITEASNKYKLPFFIIDFADTEPAKKEVRSRLDTLNIPFFISNIELNTLPIFPESVANKITSKD